MAAGRRKTPASDRFHRALIQPGAKAPLQPHVADAAVATHHDLEDDFPFEVPASCILRSRRVRRARSLYQSPFPGTGSICRGRISHGYSTERLTCARLRELVKNPTLQRLTLITVEDQQLWDQAGELIQKYVAPRVRAK